jgi:hypothetical protein
MPDEQNPATEGDREWRELTQKTHELARKLQPPHDDEAERGNAAPADPKADDAA